MTFTGLFRADSDVIISKDSYCNFHLCLYSIIHGPDRQIDSVVFSFQHFYAYTVVRSSNWWRQLFHFTWIYSISIFSISNPLWGLREKVPWQHLSLSTIISNKDVLVDPPLTQEGLVVQHTLMNMQSEAFFVMTFMPVRPWGNMALEYSSIMYQWCYYGLWW
jgi:hypothetical protein